MSRVSLQDCTWCKLSRTRTQVIQGAGSLDTGIMFLSESPGRGEDETGEPFTGKHTEAVFDGVLDALDLGRDDVWVTYVVKCRTVDYDEYNGKIKQRAPEMEEMEACSEWLDLELETIKPKIIVALGATALYSLTKLTGIYEHRGRFVSVPGKVYRIFPMFHPTFISYNRNEPSIIETVKDDLENLKKGIDKCLKRK